MLPANLEAVRNRKTGKLFILVDDSLGTHFKVINPAGELLTLPDLLFEDEPVQVNPAAGESEFTNEQLDALKAHLTAEAARASQAASVPQRRQVQEVTRAEPAAARGPSRSRGSRGSPPPRLGGPRGVAVTWTSSRLAFYRNKIEPLNSRQSFQVQVEGVGTFEISKDDFLSTFNDVVMSPSYRREGFFSYPEIPDKARQFLKQS